MGEKVVEVGDGKGGYEGLEWGRGEEGSEATGVCRAGLGWHGVWGRARTRSTADLPGERVSALSFSRPG